MALELLTYQVALVMQVMQAEVMGVFERVSCSFTGYTSINSRVGECFFRHDHEPDHIVHTCPATTDCATFLVSVQTSSVEHKP